MKRGCFKMAVFCISYLFFWGSSAMMEEVDEAALGSLNMQADEYTALVADRGNVLEEQQEKTCLQKLKNGVCAWWREGDYGCCKLKSPGYHHAIFWGSITGVAGIAALCVWHYGNHGPSCDNDNDC